MKTPAFWQANSFLSTLLLPLSFLYGAGRALAVRRARPMALPVPVICVGNLTAGGAGKTPVAMAIGAKLKEKGIHAFFLSRGYGGSLAGPVLVDPKRHNARQVGDEPLLLAGILPTIIARDRLRGARLALEQGAQAIVMDDGFQNHSLAKTLSLLVIDGTGGLGNGRLLPAGPLRETTEAGFSRADAIVVINHGPAVPDLPAGKPVVFVTAHPDERAQSLKGKKILAFCGIAYPQKFFAALKVVGPKRMARAPFPDHHLYSKSDLKALAQRAQQKQETMVTTVKDAVRLPPEFRAQVVVVDIMLDFETPALLDELLDNALHAHGKN